MISQESMEQQLRRTGTIHDGGSIQVFDTDDPTRVIVSFTDNITAFYKIKKAVIKGKGKWCNGISCLISKYLQDNGIQTHFKERISDTDQVCERVEIIPLEIIVRNVIAGSLAARLGLEEGIVPAHTIYDICYKSDPLMDPLINDYHALALKIVTPEELKGIYSITARINDLLKGLFDKAEITLVDFKIEFGRAADGSLVMCDDITPDSARFWDKITKERLDKDRFRHDNGHVGDAYRTVYERLNNILG